MKAVPMGSGYRGLTGGDGGLEGEPDFGSGGGGGGRSSYRQPEESYRPIASVVSTGRGRGWVGAGGGEWGSSDGIKGSSSGGSGGGGGGSGGGGGGGAGGSMLAKVCCAALVPVLVAASFSSMYAGKL